MTVEAKGTPSYTLAGTVQHQKHAGYFGCVYGRLLVLSAPNGCCMPCRELLYLDLALENVVRAAAERGAVQSGAAAAAFVGPLLQNLALSGETAERGSGASMLKFTIFLGE